MLDVSPAVDDYAVEILAMRHAAEDWLAAREIDQWRPGEVSLATVRKQIARGEFVVARHGATTSIVAAMRLIWTDRQIWQSSDAFACYVHGLMIDRDQAGRGWGGELLTWAAEHARRAGASLLRLDCAETNPRLKQYYRDAGFIEVGERTFGAAGLSVTLFEKVLD